MFFFSFEPIHFFSFHNFEGLFEGFQIIKRCLTIGSEDPSTTNKRIPLHNLHDAHFNTPIFQSKCHDWHLAVTKTHLSPTTSTIPLLKGKLELTAPTMLSFFSPLNSFNGKHIFWDSLSKPKIVMKDLWPEEKEILFVFLSLPSSPTALVTQ